MKLEGFRTVVCFQSASCSEHAYFRRKIATSAYYDSILSIPASLLGGSLLHLQHSCIKKVKNSAFFHALFF